MSPVGKNLVLALVDPVLVEIWSNTFFFSSRSPIGWTSFDVFTQALQMIIRKVIHITVP